MSMLRSLALPLLCLVLISCADDLPRASEADQAVEYGYAELTITRQVQAEIRVRLTNPTRRITTERYAACIVAQEAQSRGFVWVKRLRGRRRIDEPTEDLAVIYILSRLKEPEGEGVFTAALFRSLCEVDGIPTEPREPAVDTVVPDLALGGGGAPVEGPNAATPPEESAPEPEPVIGIETGPEPEFDPPPVDPVDGI